MSLVLVFALVAGVVLPTVNANETGKKKNTSSKKVLVVYFSATGTTKSAAKKIWNATGGTLYQIKAADPYTSKDLDYDTGDCRANV